MLPVNPKQCSEAFLFLATNATEDQAPATLRLTRQRPKLKSNGMPIWQTNPHKNPKTSTDLALVCYPQEFLPFNICQHTS